MELFLNLVWLFLSMGLVTWWVRSARAQKAYGGWTVAVSLVLLLVMLLPAISMTDDLQLMNMPAEREHGLLLRYEAVLVPLRSFLPFQAVCLLTPGALLPMSGWLAATVGPKTFSAVVRTGAVRAFGTRPPTQPDAVNA